jgi:hypothetical protein
MRELVDDYFPQFAKIRLVLNNLNIHPQEAVIRLFSQKKPKEYSGSWSFMPLPNFG